MSPAPSKWVTIPLSSPVWIKHQYTLLSMPQWLLGKEGRGGEGIKKGETGVCCFFLAVPRAPTHVKNISLSHQSSTGVTGRGANLGAGWN